MQKAPLGTNPCGASAWRAAGSSGYRPGPLLSVAPTQGGLEPPNRRCPFVLLLRVTLRQLVSRTQTRLSVGFVRLPSMTAASGLAVESRARFLFVCTSLRESWPSASPVASPLLGHSCPVQPPVWRASSFPFRVDPARVSDGPSYRFFVWRYRLNALLTGPSLAPEGPIRVQESGGRSPIRGDLLQSRRRAMQESTQSMTTRETTGAVHSGRHGAP